MNFKRMAVTTFCAAVLALPIIYFVWPEASGDLRGFTALLFGLCAAFMLSWVGVSVANRRRRQVLGFIETRILNTSDDLEIPLRQILASKAEHVREADEWLKSLYNDGLTALGFETRESDAARLFYSAEEKAQNNLTSALAAFDEAYDLAEKLQREFPGIDLDGRDWKKYLNKEELQEKLA